MSEIFHLAFPVKDIEATKWFYGEVLGCKIGRSTQHWVDFDFFGNQLSAHVNEQAVYTPFTSIVDDKEVPLRHFGAVLSWDEWDSLAKRLKEKGVEFITEPHIRFEGKPGEQGSMFFYDNSGNAIELKGFRDLNQVFSG